MGHPRNRGWPIHNHKGETMTLSLATARSVLRGIGDYTSADFDQLGINKEHFDLTCGARPWKRDHIPPVMRTLNALMFGTLEQLGMPKITIPAEYVAAIVATYVAPGNRMIACVWLAQEHRTGVGALELSARGQQSKELAPATADQLFALVVALSDSDETTEARKNFLRRLSVAYDQATEDFTQ